MLNFKLWLEDDISEYDPPDENQIQNIINNPISVNNRKDFEGEFFIFTFPIRKEEFKIRYGSIISPNAPKGSLISACLKMYKSRSYKKLYDLLLSIKNDQKLKKQIINYRIF